MQYLLGAVFVAIAVVSGWLFYLKENVPTIAQLVQTEPSPDPIPVKKNAYFQLLGLFASHGNDPFQRGMQFVVDYEESLLDTSTIILSDNKIVEVEVRLDIACDIVELCVQGVWTHPEQAEENLHRYGFLLKRYQTLRDFESYSPVVKPSFEEPAVSIKELSNLHQLLSMQIAYQYLGGEQSAAMRNLAVYLDIARFIGQQTSNAMLKMVMSAQYSALLHTISVLTNMNGYSDELANVVHNQKPFSAAELSFRNQIMRDYTLVQNYLELLHKDQPLANKNQRQMVIDYYNQQLLVDLMPSDGLNAYLKAKPVPPDFISQSPVIDGQLLAQMVVKDYASYIANVRNNALLLELLKVKMALVQNKNKSEDIAAYLQRFNASRPADMPEVYWQEQQKSLYVKGVAEIDTALALEIKG